MRKRPITLNDIAAFLIFCLAVYGFIALIDGLFKALGVG